VGFNAGLDHALVISGVPDHSAAAAVAHTCESVNPLLVASGLALIICIPEDGPTHIIATSPALKTAILDSPTTDDLASAIRSHQPPAASAAQSIDSPTRN
jgi:hypothetical protein